MSHPIDSSLSTRRRRVGASALGEATDFFLWLVGKVVWSAGVVVLGLFVIGAFKASPVVGAVVLAIALAIAYFMVRKR